MHASTGKHALPLLSAHRSSLRSPPDGMGCSRRRAIVNSPPPVFRRCVTKSIKNETTGFADALPRTLTLQEDGRCRPSVGTTLNAITHETIHSDPSAASCNTCPACSRSGEDRLSQYPSAIRPLHIRPGSLLPGS